MHAFVGRTTFNRRAARRLSAVVLGGIAARHLLCAVSLVAAEAKSLTLTVAASEKPRAAAPVTVEVDWPEEYAGLSAFELRSESGETTWAQVASPALLDATDKRRIVFVQPALAAGRTAVWTAKISGHAPGPGESAAFHWGESDGATMSLKFGDRSVLSYEHKPLEESSPAAREATYKVYHHLFDPSGSRRVTKGLGGLYPHHRGLYYGFNKISYGDGKKADVWHCSGDAFQSHEGVTSVSSGPVLGRHQLAIDWHGEKKEVFAREQRELTVFALPGGQLVEFASRLKSAAGAVRLDGDPQHAGFQFRADNEVADATKGETIYIRPSGVDQPGKTRNWPEDKTQVNLPWNAMSFVLSGQRYSAVYCDRPENPKEARYSERDYGRFGSYFEYDLLPEKPLEIRYRLWLQAGQITVKEADAIHRAFVEPAKVELTWR